MNQPMERSYRWLLWTLALLGLTADLTSKYGVFAWLYDDAVRHERYYGEYIIVPGAFRLLAQFTPQPPAPDQWLSPLRNWGVELLPHVNHGALFGFGGHHEHLANAIFTLISLVASVAIIYWGTRRATAQDWLLCVALGLILGGTLGNLYDRVVFGGVRDFLYFKYRWIDWPVFNIADCCLVCGAFLLFIQAFWQQPATSTDASDHADATPEPTRVPVAQAK
ncbi:MAG: signal peptidase II [Gemmataceae bacterium]